MSLNVHPTKHAVTRSNHSTSSHTLRHRISPPSDKCPTMTGPIEHR
jgi:hypothetical protein